MFVIASAVPHGGAWCVRAGFCTAWYDRNPFAVKLARIPWTDPTVYLSVQTLIQMLALAAAGAALITYARTNPWHHGGLPETVSSAKDDLPKKTRGANPAAGAPAVGSVAAPGVPAEAGSPPSASPAPPSGAPA